MNSSYRTFFFRKTLIILNKCISYSTVEFTLRVINLTEPSAIVVKFLRHN